MKSEKKKINKYIKSGLHIHINKCIDSNLLCSYSIDNDVFKFRFRNFLKILNGSFFIYERPIHFLKNAK